MERIIVGEKIRAVIAAKLNVDPGTIKGETRLAEDLGLDSFGGIEIVFDIEDAFGLKIPDSDFSHVRTVDDIIDYVVAREAKRGAKPKPV